MPLQFPSEWRYTASDSFGGMSDATVREFHTLAVRVAAAVEHPQGVIERFKARFAAVNGDTAMSSSSYSFSLTDLWDGMTEASTNAPLFVDAFWSSLELLSRQGVPTPHVCSANA